MPTIEALETKGGSNSLTDFINELAVKHRGQEHRYVQELKMVVRQFTEFGPRMNMMMSRKFPPFKSLHSIYPGLAELRTKKCRYFIYDTGLNGLWIGLHGYEKKSQDIPRNEIAKAKGEIQQWIKNNINPKELLA